MFMGNSGQPNKTRPSADAYYPTARLTYQSKLEDPYSSHSVILARVGEGKGGGCWMSVRRKGCSRRNSPNVDSR